MNEIIEQTIEQDTNIKEFDLIESSIQEMKDSYLVLKTNGLDDKDAFHAVHEAKMVLVKKRTAIERIRKSKVEDAVKYQKAVNGEAKRIIGLLEPMESHLQAEEDKVLNEKKRIADAESLRLAERFNSRIKLLQSINFIVQPEFFDKLKEMTDEYFQEKYENQKVVFDAEQTRKAEEAKLIEETNKRLAEEALRLETIRKEQEIAEAKIKFEKDALDAEKRKIEVEKLEETRKKEMEIAIENAKKEAAEKAVREAEEKAKRDAIEKFNKEEFAKAEASRIESMRPDKEKLLKFAESINRFILTFPAIESKIGRSLLSGTLKELKSLAERLTEKAGSL